MDQNTSSTMRSWIMWTWKDCIMLCCFSLRLRKKRFRTAPHFINKVDNYSILKLILIFWKQKNTWRLRGSKVPPQFTYSKGWRNFQFLKIDEQIINMHPLRQYQLLYWENFCNHCKLLVGKVSKKGCQTGPEYDFDRHYFARSFVQGLSRNKTFRSTVLSSATTSVQATGKYFKD